MVEIISAEMRIRIAQNELARYERHVVFTTPGDPTNFNPAADAYAEQLTGSMLRSMIEENVRRRIYKAVRAIEKACWRPMSVCYRPPRAGGVAP